MTQDALFQQVLEDAEMEAKRVLAEAVSEHNPLEIIGLFSGGNDSTVMVHLLRQRLDSVAHISTGIGVPETTAFVVAQAKAWGLRLRLLETPPSVYDDFVLGGPYVKGKAQGFPGPSGHNAIYWHLKERRLRELRREVVKERGERVMFVTGVRRHESRRRARGSAGTRREGSIVWVNAIAHFDSRLMNEYRERHPTCPRNPVADLLHRSGECLCGAFAKPNELEEITLWYPEVAERIRNLERRAEELGIPRCKWGGDGRSLPAAPPGPLCHDCTLFDPDELTQKVDSATQGVE